MWDVDIEISAGPVRPVSTTLFDTTDLMVSQPCWLMGWSLREFSGAATCTLEYKSGDTPVAEITLAAGATETVWLGPLGVYCAGGLKRVTVSGQWTGVLYVSYQKARSGDE